MTATLGSAQPRRKLAKYGKSSCRRLPDFQRPFEHTLKEQSTALSNGGKPEPWVLSPADVSPPDNGSFPRSLQEETLSPKRFVAPPVDAPLTLHQRTSGFMPRESHSRTGVTRPSRKPAVSSEAAVFDIPSSDDEPKTPHRTIQRKTTPSRNPLISRSRASLVKSDMSASSNLGASPTIGERQTWARPKRRRFSPPSPADEDEVGFDDAKIQNRIAAETELRPGTSDLSNRRRFDRCVVQGPSPERPGGNKARLSASPREGHGIRHTAHVVPATREPLPAAGSTPTIAQRDLRSGINTKEQQTRASIRKGVLAITAGSTSIRNPKNDTTRAETVRVRVAGTEERGDSSSPPVMQEQPTESAQMQLGQILEEHLLLPATPPRQSKSDRAITSPRQASLWDQLLDGRSGPESVDLPRLGAARSSAGTRAKSQPRSEATLKSTKSEPTRLARGDQYSAFKPRRRLIDSLTRGPPTGDDLLEDATVHSPSKDVEFLVGVNDHPNTREETKDQLLSVASDQAITFDEAIGSQPSAPHVVCSGDQEGPKVTYARQRSYLTESASDDHAFLETSFDELSGMSTQKRRRGENINLVPAGTLQKLSGDADTVEGASEAGIRSIHELRHAGGNKKFLDESEALFEDIDDRSTSAFSRRRSALLDVAAKLADKQYTSQFVARGMEYRLFHNLDEEHDVVTSFILASLIVILVQGNTASHLVQFVRRQGAVNMLMRLIIVDKDIGQIVKDRSRNMSKASQAQVTDYATTVLQSLAWKSEKPAKLSPRTIGLRSMELLVRQSREAGVTEKFMRDEAITHLIRLLPSRVEHGSLSTLSVQQMHDVQTTLTILESYVIDAGLTTRANEPHIPPIMDCFLWIFRAEGSQSRQAQLPMLRLILNMTNNNQSTSSLAATPAVLEHLIALIVGDFGSVGSSLNDEERSFTLDRLILALAAMINFSEWNDSVRGRVLSQRVNQRSLLDELLDLFLAGLDKAFEAESMEESHSNVAFGYLAVLLGNLCLDPGIRQQVRSRLPKATLRPLVSAIEEFLLYHRKVDDQRTQGEGGSEHRDGFVKRLQGVVVGLKTE
ncbi:MAG: hypothetical protein M1833_005451 [Piccolia ochrophora]|nr:MAG: hypothetical protein M1833_005451 [Piccolia ochrophora]